MLKTFEFQEDTEASLYGDFGKVCSLYHARVLLFE